MTQEQGVHSVDWQDWPRVEYPDVYNYLIQTPSIYTGESLRAYKSLDGYYWIYFESRGINWWKTPPESPDANPIENLWHELKVCCMIYNWV